MTRTDCVHWEACERCKKKAMQMSGGMYLFVDCWECELYVSRLALVQWWNEGTELRQKMCRLQGYLSDFGLGLGSEGKVPF